jgi:hypothetical protein
MTGPAPLWLWATLPLRRELQAEYDLLLQAHIEQAEQATRGVMLNARAVAAGRSIGELFRVNTATANAWASEELREFWRTHPRPTFVQYEAHRLADTEEWYPWS